MILQKRADAIIHRAMRSLVEPYAVFAFDQPDFEGGFIPIYTIYGGPYHESSVTADTLRELGIPVPE